MPGATVGALVTVVPVLAASVRRACFQTSFLSTSARQVIVAEVQVFSNGAAKEKPCRAAGLEAKPKHFTSGTVLESSKVSRCAETGALVPTCFGRRAVAAFGDVIEVLSVEPRSPVPVVGLLLFRRGMVGKAASRVGDAGQHRRGDAGTTDLTPATAVRRAVNRDSGIGVGVGRPIRRATVRAGAVADDELVIGDRLHGTDATAAAAPAVLFTGKIAVAANDVRAARRDHIGRYAGVVRA